MKADYRLDDGDIPTRIVMVKWWDTASVHGWHENSRSADIAQCVTVGWLVCSDKRILQIAQSHDDEGHIDEIISIPQSAVISRRYVT